MTGGSGLVGRHLRLLMPEATYVSGREFDLTRPGQVDRLLSMERWTRVVHLSALVGGILDNMARPTAYLEDNLLMNTYFLRRCRETEIPRLTAILSSCIYPDADSLSLGYGYPMREEAMHAGPPAKSNLGYAVAKRALSTQVDLTNEETGGGWNYLVPCNLYGEGDKEDHGRSHFVTALLRKIREANETGGDHIVLLGDGTPRRQFMHAADLAACIARMVREDITESFNVCVPDNPTVEEIARVALRATGSNHLELRFTGDRLENGQMRKDISNARMMRLMPDFRFTPLEAGIQAVYQYQTR